MKIIATIVLLLGISSHDIQVARYTISQVDTGLKIEFVFEYEDVLETQNELNKELNDNNLQAYINSNFSIELNDISQVIAFGKMEIKKNHVHLIGRVENVVQKIETINIENKCLINIDNHSNIVQLHLDSGQRDFLMNKRRTSIQVDYK